MKSSYYTIVSLCFVVLFSCNKKKTIDQDTDNLFKFRNYISYTTSGLQSVTSHITINLAKEACARWNAPATASRSRTGPGRHSSPSPRRWPSSPRTCRSCAFPPGIVCPTTAFRPTRRSRPPEWRRSRLSRIGGLGRFALPYSRTCMSAHLG